MKITTKHRVLSQFMAVAQHAVSQQAFSLRFPIFREAGALELMIAKNHYLVTSRPATDIFDHRVRLHAWGGGGEDVL
ncbi:hypothetical protein EYF80_028111 [Liparis tanakae]|uniref:Uncharacterized protein n=1 Tax=Liparis tanakae TaxID=230148 RepID=A0A4Z2H7Q9_9TELE|nr:hypothetical protein EYF80_028111 [Liparis tanakae]